MSTTSDAEARIDQTAPGGSGRVDRNRQPSAVRWCCDGANKPPKMAPRRSGSGLSSHRAFYSRSAADLGGEIGRLAPAQRKIRHLRVRVEQEEGDPFRRKVRLARDCFKRGSVGAGPPLVGVHHMTDGAPALGEVGSHGSGSAAIASDPLSPAAATSRTRICLKTKRIRRSPSMSDDVRCSSALAPWVRSSAMIGSTSGEGRKADIS